MSLLASILAQAVAAVPQATPGAAAAAAAGAGAAAAPIGLSLNEIITIVVSTASFLFAIAAFFRGTFEERRKLILDQILQEIQTLEEMSVEIVAQVESILLTTTHSGHTASHAYIQTQCEFRKAEVHLENLSIALGPEGDAAHKRYVIWHRALTADRFPISDVAHVYLSSDDRYTRVAAAQSEWRKYLFDLKMRCLRYKVKFWK